MSLRPATDADFDAIHAVHTQVLGDHDVFTYLYPYRHEFPDDFNEALLENTRRRLINVDPKTHHNIVIEDDGRIVGWALWIRKHGNEKPKDDEEDVVNGILEVHKVVEVQSVEGEQINRAMDYSRLKSHNQRKDDDETRYGLKQLHWYISAIAILPDYRRKGYGRKLCEWGMKKAMDEGTWCALSATSDGVKLYESLGWKKVGRRSQPWDQAHSGLGAGSKEPPLRDDWEAKEEIVVMKWGVDKEGYELFE